MKSKAILFGINYEGTELELGGCANDANNLNEYLKTLNINNTKVFTDVNPETKNDVTASGIYINILKLANESFSENLDFVWISYSGHGSFVKDLDGDEISGYDQCIVPLDYEKNGYITDDTIVYLLNLFNPKTKIFLLFDSCYSGSVCDLKYRYTSDTTTIIENVKAKCKSEIICISGCKDDQTSADCEYTMNHLKIHGGALTTAFLSTLKNNPEYIDNIFSLTKCMKQKILDWNLTQIPQITSSYKLENNYQVLKYRNTQNILNVLNVNINYNN
jgi:hypothetical protein